MERLLDSELPAGGLEVDLDVGVTATPSDGGERLCDRRVGCLAQ